MATKNRGFFPFLGIGDPRQNPAGWWPTTGGECVGDQAQAKGFPIWGGGRTEFHQNQLPAAAWVGDGERRLGG
jgi:hypothetical protein